ncbi:MAG: FAD-dependent oxidoreductase [Chloroflexi bacterium]|nr:FAD-dependent oxidoreductase [Chloroflexota bacterium]MCI0574736.1 FAD-dependent oxidoreductase [Chloroflexota bacterium]MCI0646293.1 FAD-dependent oxidoreductase [Chloroflexota bacterium]MCI0730309.1 FAD-dependent oxidoreductase [Chloroflexota bacterium]
MSKQKMQIVVLGAGYAGMMAAIRLAGKTKQQQVAVTLVNAAAHFVERPRLYETATGRPPRPRPLVEMLKGMGFVIPL